MKQKSELEDQKPSMAYNKPMNSFVSLTGQKNRYAIFCPLSGRYALNQRKIMKLLLTILILLFSSNAFSQSVNCENAPSDAVVELPDPINKWSVIFCSPKGHVLAGSDGIVWVTKNNSSFMFRANRKVTPESTQHSSYFKKIVHRNINLIPIKCLLKL